jgi:hypothetical protein
MANQAQRREARERGEARLAQLQRRDQTILTEQRQAQLAADAKFQRLRALRLAKEASEPPDAKPETSKPAAGKSMTARPGAGKTAKKSQPAPEDS